MLYDAGLANKLLRVMAVAYKEAFVEI